MPLAGLIPRPTAIGAPGFEPGTSCSQSRRATGLRHAPKSGEDSAMRVGRVAIRPRRRGRPRRGRPDDVRGVPRPRAAALVWALASLAPAAAAAQPVPRPAPFETLRVEMGGLRGLGGDVLEAWGPARGGFLYLGAPWGGGELGGRVELVRHAARGGTGGDLDEARALVGWARGLPLPGPFALRLGGELGVDYLRLPRDDNPLETEVVAGLAAGLSWRVTDAWSLAAGLQRRWTFTDPTLRRDAATLGLSRTFGLPRRAREALGGRPPGVSPAPPGAAPAAQPYATLPVPLPDGLRWAAVLADVSGWSTRTVDGVAVGVAPPGTPSAGAGHLAVRVDGWELPLELLGVLAPDRLPIEPGSVAGLAVRPGFAAGRPGADAVLDVTTRAVPRGLSVRLGAHGANATGDGGPRAVVVGEGPNVESLEWGYGGGFSWGGGHADVQAEGSHHRRWVSELPVFRRNFEAVDPEVRWPWVDVRRGRVAARAAAGAFRIDATAGGSRIDDFVLLPGLPREVPASSTLTAAWVRGEGDVGAGRMLGWWLGRATQGMETTENRLGRTLDWHETVSSGRVSIGRGRGGVGLTLERHASRAGVALSDDVDGRVAADAHGTLDLGASGLDLALTGSGLRHDGRWGGSASAALVHAVSGSETGLRLAGEVAPPASREGLWLAEGRGLGVLERWGIGGPSPAEPPTALRRGVVEAWHRRGDARGWAELRGRLDRAEGWWLPRLDVVTEEGVPGAAGPLELDTEAGGVLGWLGVRYGWSYGTLEGWGDHAVRGVLDGDAALERAHASLPRHRSVHRLRWRPVDDLAVTARLEARSASRHEGFRDAGPLFPADLPGGAWLDLGATKGLLGGRASLEMVVRDVLDRELATHPLAGTPGLTLEVLGRVRLGAQPEPDPSLPSSASRRR